MPSHAPFTGEFFHAIDAKSRLTIPSKLRDVIQPREQTHAFYAVAEYDRSLCLYTPETYRERAPKFDPDDLVDEDVRNFQRLYYGLSEYVEVDRLGRVLLPERLLKRCKITKNVAIVGAYDHIQVWDAECWQAWLEKAYPKRDDLAARTVERKKAREAAFAATPAADAAGQEDEAGPPAD